MPEVVTVDVKKLNPDFDERLLSGGAILSAGLGKLVSGFESKLLREAILSLLVNAREV